MAKREPLGRDPLEWIKRTKPADEEEKQPPAPPKEEPPPAPPAAEAQEPPPAEKPADSSSWLDALATAEEPPAAEEPAAPAPQAEEPAAPAPAPQEEPTPAEPLPEPPAPMETVTAQAAPEPAPSAWPAAVVQAEPAEEPGDESGEPSEEEEPTQIVGATSEVEEATAAKLLAEKKKYVHVGSTDDEVDTRPRVDSNEYLSTPFPAPQQSSLVYAIIMIVCIFLMGLLVYFWAEGRMRSLENDLETRIQKLEKALKAQPSDDSRRAQ